MNTMLLGKKEVAHLLDMGEVIGAIEQVFRDLAAGRTSMPPKVYVELEKGDLRAMPAAIPGAVGVKWINVHMGNWELGLPTIMGTLIYNDPDTGYPLAIMDATEITAYRTAATSALASKYLARPNSRSLGLVGAGHQAYVHLQAHIRLFSLDSIKVYDLRAEAADRFVTCFPQHPVRKASPEQVVAADIVCTLTPARGPVVQASWVRPGAHINAVGADAAGKQELDPAILGRARVVVDDLYQACHAGEVNVAVSQGLFRQEQVYATLGEIVSGTKPGRDDAQAITIFDSTGLAIEDMATAKLVYEKARKRGGYLTVELV